MSQELIIVVVVFVVIVSWFNHIWKFEIDFVRIIDTKVSSGADTSERMRLHEAEQLLYATDLWFLMLPLHCGRGVRAMHYILVSFARSRTCLFCFKLQFVLRNKSIKLISRSIGNDKALDIVHCGGWAKSVLWAEVSSSRTTCILAPICSLQLLTATNPYFSSRSWTGIWAA